MSSAKPLIITATPNICWLEPDVPYPTTAPEVAAEAVRCREADAAIVHIHAEGRWTETIGALRADTDLIVQCGMSSLPIAERMEVFDQRADMISIIVSHHDEAFTGLDVHVLHPREELAEYAELSRRFGTKLELETWHTGSIWNIHWMIEQGLLDAPHFTSLFFGWPGGSWSPATVEELQHRKRYLPDGCVNTVSVMGAEQLTLLLAAITHGDHVRVGTEDRPYHATGERAQTHELVAEIAGLARACGREVATPEQAREIIGLTQVPA